MRRHPRTVIIVLSLCIFVLGALAYYFGRDDKSYNGEFNVHFIDVGQGNATLLERNGHFAIIDGGDADATFRLTVYLQQQGVKKLDYVIVTHYDTDHLYGLVNIIYSFEVGEVLAPDYTVDTKIYRSFKNALMVKGLTFRQPKLGEEFDFEDVSMVCVAPCRDDYENENDYSIGFKISYGDIDYLLCGDATYRSEMDIIMNGENLESEVYLVSHHGSGSSSTTEFLEKIRPRISVISVGENNDYGHPRGKVLRRLEKIGSEIYRTDMLGDIVISTDGSKLSVKCNGKDTVLGQEKKNIGYILNMRSEKFHKRDCEAVEEMNPENKLVFLGTREQLIKLNYHPCKMCNP